MDGFDGMVGGSLGSGYNVSKLLPSVGIPGLVVLLLTIVSLWVLFKKGRDKGWKSLVPLLNVYIEYKIAWKTKKFWQAVLWIVLGIGCSTATTLISTSGGNSLVALIIALVGLFFAILSLINAIKLNVRLAKAFGREGIFALGLILLPIVFLPVLAFGKTSYKGPQA